MVINIKGHKANNIPKLINFIETFKQETARKRQTYTFTNKAYNNSMHHNSTNHRTKRLHSNESKLSFAGGKKQEWTTVHLDKTQQETINLQLVYKPSVKHVS
jgi:hypothetical protein